jgi:hypothetical protein
MTSTSNQTMTCNYPSRKQKDGAKDQSRKVMIKNESFSNEGPTSTNRK